MWSTLRVKAAEMPWGTEVGDDAAAERAEVGNAAEVAEDATAAAEVGEGAELAEVEGGDDAAAEAEEGAEVWSRATTTPSAILSR